MIVEFSVNGVPIRLTEERLNHILRNHPEVEKEKVLETLSNPDLVQKGGFGLSSCNKEICKDSCE